MSSRIHDADVQLLATIAVNLRGDYVDPEKNQWEGSPFGWILSRPSRQRGKIGEQLVAGFCAARNLDVVATGDAEADRIINGRRVEIKFSTLWSSGVYKFQQLRDQNYEYVICLGLSPFNAHCWVIPKRILMTGNRQPGVTGQHRGRAGTDTAWLSFAAANPPAWLSSYGGTLGQAVRILAGFR